MASPLLVVLDRLKNLQTDARNPGHQWLNLSWINVNEHDARVAVDGLQRLLLEEQQQAENSTSSSPRITTGLELNRGHLSDEAVEIFAAFFRQTTHLSALRLHNPSPRILRALHTNTSVKDLSIHDIYQDDGDGQVQVSIAQLLQHKPNLSRLYVHNCEIHVSSLAPFLRLGFPYLRKLGLSHGSLADDDIQSIIQALIAGNHHQRLEELDFNSNELTHRGLAVLGALKPSAFSRLKKLIISFNSGMLDDNDVTQRFIREVLLAPNTSMKELSVECSSRTARGLILLIKALETNTTLLFLDISHDDLCKVDTQALRGQMIESMPKMKGVLYLIADWYRMHKGDISHDDDEEMLKAIRQNTSFYQLAWDGSEGSLECAEGLDLYQTPTVRAIMKRNEQLRHIDGLLGSTTAAVTTTDTGTATETTTTTRPAEIPRSLWSWVLANVGHGRESASPVFKVLQDRLASWPESSTVIDQQSGDKKRKRNDDAVVVEERQH